ncbi:MAG: hypothetical protein EXR12_15120 [Rhodospirillaceae bacterium]|nr:hypothetical protein [Rhodospirillaceae bacterium]
MNRTIVAFLVAPLWVPLAFMIVGAFGRQMELAALYAVSGGMATYAATLIFGYPALALMWRCKLTGPWTAAVVGLAIGILSFFTFMIGVGLFLVDAKGGSVRKMLRNDIDNLINARISLVDFQGLVAPGLVGVVIGLTLWAIARPDRRALP